MCLILTMNSIDIMSVREFDRLITYSYPVQLFEIRITVERPINLRRNSIAVRIVSGRDAMESLFNEKFSNFI